MTLRKWLAPVAAKAGIPTGLVLSLVALALVAAQQPAAAQAPAARAPAPRAGPVAPPAAAQIAGKGQTLALDDKQRAMVGRVSAYLSSVQNMTGDFVQVGPDGKRNEGQFYISKPGKVRFEYEAPSPIDIIADGNSVAVRDRNLATQDLFPLSQTPLRFLLQEKIDLLHDTGLVGVYADDVFVTVVIEEKTPIVGTSRLMLMFGATDFQLRQWTVTDPQGYDTTVAVYNLNTKAKPAASLFRIDYTRYVQ
jgi:outer membrane lipoprotein-sorting protein